MCLESTVVQVSLDESAGSEGDLDGITTDADAEAAAAAAADADDIMAWGDALKKRGRHRLTRNAQ